MSGCRQGEILSMLAQAEGIEEALVYSTCNRTEFVVWGDATLAVNSILRLLTAEYDLKLQEWNSFYRLLDERALAHAFRVSCGLDSMCIGEEHIARQVNIAWQQARNAGCTGRYLDTILRKALSIRRRVRRETSLGAHFVSASYAAVRLAHPAPFAARNRAGRPGPLSRGARGPNAARRGQHPFRQPAHHGP